IIHAGIGKVSFDADKLKENAQELMSTLIKMKPTAAKGTYVKSVYLSSTMSPGIAIDTKSVN
ncbi:50S ribosomal protein L1, partial [Chryseobacterium sp. SIMBA_029]